MNSIHPNHIIKQGIFWNMKTFQRLQKFEDWNTVAKNTIRINVRHTGFYEHEFSALSKKA